MMTFEPLFYVALATIAIGNGLFLPSLPSQIGDLYERDDPRARPGLQRLLRRRQHRRIPGAADLRNAGRDFTAGTRASAPRASAWSPGLLIYLSGQRYLPGADARQPRIGQPAAPREGLARDTLLLLLGMGLAVTVFRSAYEQVGNTVALWADSGVDQHGGPFRDPDDLVPCRSIRCASC